MQDGLVFANGWLKMKMKGMMHPVLMLLMLGDGDADPDANADADAEIAVYKCSTSYIQISDGCLEDDLIVSDKKLLSNNR